MKNMLIVLAGMLLLMSCAAGQKETKTEADKTVEESGGYDESFDPQTLEDDDIVIERKNNGKQREAVTHTKAVETVSDSAADYREADGFRVQIFATRDIEAATLTQQKAIEQFGGMNYKTYLIFEAPFYKVRIGDAVERAEADKIRDAAKELGFDQAFTVRSRVNTPVGE